MQASYVIGGLIYNVSWASTIFGMLCAVFSACLGIAARVWLTPMMLPTGPVGFGGAAFLFSCLRFHKTFMTPVELAEMTVPEDHLYQRLMAKKVMADVVASVMPQEDGKANANPPALMSRPSHRLTDAFLTAISYGAYGLHTFEPTAVGQSAFRGMTHEERAQVDPPKIMISMLLDVYAKLNQNEAALWMEQMGGEATFGHDTDFQETVLAFLLLTGMRKPTKEDLALFQARWAFIRDERIAVHLDAADATREVFFVMFLLTGMRDRQLQNQMKTFFNFADKDGDGSISLSEFQAQAGLAYPGQAWIRKVVNELFESDDNGYITPEDLVELAFKRNPERWIAVLKALPARIAAIKAGKGRPGLMMKVVSGLTGSVSNRPKRSRSQSSRICESPSPALSSLSSSSSLPPSSLASSHAPLPPAPLS